MQEYSFAATTKSRKPRSVAADGKSYFSYSQIARTVSETVPLVRSFNPDVIVAIGGGGFIPARMLGTEIKVPILAISLSLYGDDTHTAHETGKVTTTQWLDDDVRVKGKRVLIVDEVDDTRTTLQHAVKELTRRNSPATVAVMVVHNKLKSKRGSLPQDITYIAGESVPGDAWNCYPWDAQVYGNDIDVHERIACACAGEEAPVVATTNDVQHQSQRQRFGKNDRIIFYSSAIGFVTGVATVFAALALAVNKR